MTSLDQVAKEHLCCTAHMFFHYSLHQQFVWWHRQLNHPNLTYLLQLVLTNCYDTMKVQCDLYVGVATHTNDSS